MENNPDNPQSPSEPNKPDLSKTADQLSQHGKELKEKAIQVGQDVKEHASANVEYASTITKEKLSCGFGALNDYIKANPLTSIIAAFGFGYVVGRISNK